MNKMAKWWARVWIALVCDEEWFEDAQSNACRDPLGFYILYVCSSLATLQQCTMYQSSNTCGAFSLFFNIRTATTTQNIIEIIQNRLGSQFQNI